jgi:hypothetical protein
MNLECECGWSGSILAMECREYNGTVSVMCPQCEGWIETYFTPEELHEIEEQEGKQCPPKR